MRSNHKRIVNFSRKSDKKIEQQKDNPLKLRSTEKGKEIGKSLFDCGKVALAIYTSENLPFETN